MGCPPGGDHGAGASAAKTAQLKRISDELAAHLGAGRGGGAAKARVVSPFGKVWDVEVGRDRDGGAFLGRGWPEFAAAHGVGVGWFLVLRHDGGGVLTVKVFDTTCCLKEFGAPTSVPTTRGRIRGASRKPQFIRVLLPGSMKKMMIPNKFVQHYITEALLNSQMVNILSPLGKFWRVELEKDQPSVYFSGGWSQFLSFHDISEGDVVLFRHEGNMVFKIKVFGLNGCQKDYKTKDIRILQNTKNQQEAPSFSGRECNKKKRVFGKENQQETPCSRARRRKKTKSGQEAQKQNILRSIYEIGPPSWIKKRITNYTLRKNLISFSVIFCRSIGFLKYCFITLKTSTGRSSRSWEVAGRPYKGGCYLLGGAWRRFCQDNGLKEGDVCTFNIVRTTLWHVVIERC